ncbi:MAG: hypothetical protein M9896_13620, partial [Candidatus Promineofilum sp.]|nr:hypothetical protein [Promineifilum sp.]
VSVLRQIHDELDAAVLEAYGWPIGQSDEELLERLVELNGERAAEEARGHVRWLRPEYQAPDAAAVVVSQPVLLEEKAAVAPTDVPAWPDGLAARAAALRAALVAFGRPVSAEEVTAAFDGKVTKARREQVQELLETLNALGQARKGEGGGLWSEG